MRLFRGRRGVAIITGLFVVILVTTLVTLTFSDARRSLEVTHYASFRTQAYFEARSAMERGMKQLNETPNWQAVHEGETRALHVEGQDGLNSWTWTEQLNPIDPEHIYLRSRAMVNQVEVRTCQLVSRRRPVDGLSIVLWEPDGPDTIYTKKNSSPVWEHTGPPTRMRWTQDSSGAWNQLTTDTYRDGKPRYQGNLLNMVGDRHGNLYASNYDSDRPDMVYKLDAQTKAWSLLPGVPGYKWVNGQFAATGTLVPDLDHLASNGENLLYGLNERDAGIDCITVLDVDRPEKGWALLPAAKKRWYDPKTKAWTESPDKHAGDFTNISVDSKNRVYAKLPMDDRPDTIYQFVPNKDHPEQGEWKNLPPIPQGQWHANPNPGLPPIWEDEQRYVGNARQLTVSPDGKVVARQSRDGVDTLYVFVPSDERPSGPAYLAGGSWEPIKPAPRVYYDRNHVRHQESGFSGDFKLHAMDGEGRLLTSWARDGYDTQFQ